MNEKKDRYLYSRVEQPTMVNGKEVFEMVMEYRYGKMVLNMRVIGLTIRPMEKGNSTT